MPFPPRTDSIEIAQAAYDWEQYRQIMGVIGRRLQSTGDNWRHVYKSLILLDYLLKHGPTVCGWFGGGCGCVCGGCGMIVHNYAQLVYHFPIPCVHTYHIVSMCTRHVYTHALLLHIHNVSLHTLIHTAYHCKLL